MKRRDFMIAGGAGLAAFGGFWFTQRGGNDLPALALNAQEAATAAKADTSGIVEMQLGAADAPIQITEYASFTCPHCATFHGSVFKQLKADYIDTGKVLFTYRDVYFDRPGLWAALVARCDPNRFFGISSMLYDGQKDWIGSGDGPTIAENLRKLGRIAGLEDDKLEACLADSDTAQALYGWSQKNADAAGITGTPSLVIDGELHSNMSYSDLKVILDKKLEG